MECKNCRNILNPQDNFCNVCGAKIVTSRLTLRHFWHEFSERFLNIDNTFLKTYKTLFVKPEEVIGGYIDGVRKKFLPAVSYFTIAITLTGFQIFFIRKFFPEALDLNAILPENNPTDMSYMDWIYDYFSILTLLNLPVYALMSKLTFIGKSKYNYVEHLVIMTYIFSHYSITSVFITMTSIALGANFYTLGMYAMIALALYTAFCYKRLFPLSVKEIIWRTLLFLGVGLVFMLILVVIQLVIMLMTGNFQEIMEAQKAQQAVSYMASSVINWTS